MVRVVIYRGGRTGVDGHGAWQCDGGYEVIKLG